MFNLTFLISLKILSNLFDDNEINSWIQYKFCILHFGKLHFIRKLFYVSILCLYLKNVSLLDVSFSFILSAFNMNENYLFIFLILNNFGHEVGFTFFDIFVCESLTHAYETLNKLATFKIQFLHLNSSNVKALERR